MFFGTDNMLQNNPHIHIEYGNILQNIVSPTEHRYGYEQYYDSDRFITTIVLFNRVEGGSSHMHGRLWTIE